MATLAIIAGALSLGGASTASAEEKCTSETVTYTDAMGNVVTTVREVCTEIGGGTGADGAAGGGSSGCSALGRPIPCTKNGAAWFDSQFCYAGDVTADYPPEQFGEYWGGHTNGSLYMCIGEGPSMLDVGTPSFFWVAPGEAPALVDPTVLAQRALDQMALAKPNIHLAPSPPEMTYVGLDTWLWMDENQFSSLSNTVSAGGASVTVTAAPVRASWDMGDGSGTSCPGPGRPWVKGMTSAERTDCSYAYQQVSDFESGVNYDVTVSLVYQVDWTCTGPCLAREGSLGEVDGPTSNAAIRVGERQSVVVNGGNR